MLTKFKKCIPILALLPKKLQKTEFLHTYPLSVMKHFSVKTSLDNQKYNLIKIEKK